VCAGNSGAGLFVPALLRRRVRGEEGVVCIIQMQPMQRYPSLVIRVG
jgi:hypothetical protein